jgi:cell division protein FtsW
MKQLVNNLKGDKVIWSFVAISFVLVYACFSASSNLAYLGHGTGNTLGYLVKHLVHICIGFLIIWRT